jgi:peroxiredoxin
LSPERSAAVPLIGVAAAMAAIVGALVWFRAAPGETDALVGRVAPPLRLPDAGGDPVSLAGLRGSVVFLNFWATWCAPCVKELPEFDAVWRELRGQGVALLAINAMEPGDKVRAFAQRVPLGFPLLLDPEGDAVGAYVGFSAGLPMTFVIDARGIVRQRIARPLEGAELKQRISTLLGRRG